jgi:hypothetical protein
MKDPNNYNIPPMSTGVASGVSTLAAEWILAAKERKRLLSLNVSGRVD